MAEPIIKTAEEVLKHLQSHPPSGDSYQLLISDSFTLAGKPDVTGGGMAIILHRILELGFWPDGFEQQTGFKIYRYKKR